jgi:hypothetical protein
MRNQYKVLSEKYQVVREDDKEDILTGLEELQFDPKEPITRDNIKKLGFQLADPRHRNFYEIPGDGPELRLLCQLYLQAGYAWFILDAVNVRKYSVSTLGELFNKYNELKNEISLQESDKEDILAGLGELSFDPNDRATTENIWKLGFEEVGSFRRSTLYRKTIEGKKGEIKIYLTYRFIYGEASWLVSCEITDTAIMATTLGQIVKAYELIVKRLKDGGYL